MSAVQIQHPTLPITKRVPAEKWPLWAASGWRKVEAPGSAEMPVKKAATARKRTPKKTTQPKG